MVPTGAVAAAVETSHEAGGARHMLLPLSDPNSSALLQDPLKLCSQLKEIQLRWEHLLQLRKDRKRCSVDL